MLQILGKYFNKVVWVLSFFVLVHNIVNIFSNNHAMMEILKIVSIIQIPFSLFVITLLIFSKGININIEGISLLTLEHEFHNYREILQKTKHFDIQSVNYIYEFKGENFTSIRTYKGKCISLKKIITKFPLVVAGDSNVSFEEIDCYVYNLITDSEKKDKRKPEIIHEGIYKLVNYNFNDPPLEYNQIFHIEVCYTWPNCVSSKKDYILVSPIFYKKSFDRFNVELRFFDKKPIRVKKYIVGKNKKIKFRGELTKETRQENNEYIRFIDVDVEMKDNLAFYIYIYDFKD